MNINILFEIRIQKLLNHAKKLLHLNMLSCDIWKCQNCGFLNTIVFQVFFISMIINYLYL